MGNKHRLRTVGVGYLEEQQESSLNGQTPSGKTATLSQERQATPAQGKQNHNASPISTIRPFSSTAGEPYMHSKHTVANMLDLEVILVVHGSAQEDVALEREHEISTYQTRSCRGD